MIIAIGFLVLAIALEAVAIMRLEDRMEDLEARIRYLANYVFRKEARSEEEAEGED